MKHLKIFAVAAPIATCAFYTVLPSSPRDSRCNVAPLVHAAEREMTLQQVQVIFRHGARTPVSWSKARIDHYTKLEQPVWDREKMLAEHPQGCQVSYVVTCPDGSTPTGGKSDEQRAQVMEGGMMTGELTLVGKQMLYELGKHLSKEYIHKVPFINPNLDENEVFVRTTYFGRTISSVVNLLSGLFEDGGISNVVTLETRSNNCDDLYANPKLSKVYGVHMRRVFDGEFKTVQEVAFEQEINRQMGLTDPAHYAFITQYNDLIRCREAHDLPIPQYLLDNKETISKYEEEFTDILFGKGDTTIMRAAIGSFLNTLCLRLEEAVEGKSSHKMLLYSGHDWTIIPLMNAFHVDMEEWPCFAAFLILELYKDADGEMFLKLLYNGKAVHMGLDDEYDVGFIPVHKFLKMVEDYRVYDMDAE